MPLHLGLFESLISNSMFILKTKKMNLAGQFFYWLALCSLTRPIEVLVLISPPAVSAP